MSGKRDWIGGSSISGIVGMSKYSSPVLEYLKITGQAPPLTADEEAFFARRRRLEPFIFETLEAEHGIAMPVRNQRYTDPEHAFLRAEIDGENDDANGELKSVSERAKNAAIWKRMDEESVPEEVILQVQWGLMIRPKPLGIAVGQVGFDGCHPYPVKPDPELQQLLRARAVEFWHQHILAGVAPEPQSEDDVRALYPVSKPATIVVATAEQTARLYELVRVKALRKQAEQDEKNLVAELTAILCAADTLVDPDGVQLATWRSNKPSLVCDWQALARAELGREHLAGVVAKYTENRIGARPFLAKLKVEDLPAIEDRR